MPDGSQGIESPVAPAFTVKPRLNYQRNQQGLLSGPIRQAPISSEQQTEVLSSMQPPSAATRQMESPVIKAVKLPEGIDRGTIGLPPLPPEENHR